MGWTGGEDKASPQATFSPESQGSQGRSLLFTLVIDTKIPLWDHKCGPLWPLYWVGPLSLATQIPLLLSDPPHLHLVASSVSSCSLRPTSQERLFLSPQPLKFSHSSSSLFLPPSPAPTLGKHGLAQPSVKNLYQPHVSMYPT